MKKSDIKKIVRQGYAQVATTNTSCCPTTSSCGCGAPSGLSISKAIGYSDKEIKSVPKEANLGLGCGNPIALASLKPGETVLDLGSGPGLDCFLAANKVGKYGKVIGIDMTPEMLAKARANAQKGNYSNVEFRLGEIEKLPVKDNSVDVIISNCVINLSPDKPKVFKEAFRVLKPGGRLMVSDIVLTKPLPDTVVKSVGAYVGCLSGAVLKNVYLGTVKEAGFKKIKVLDQARYPIKYMMNDPTAQALAQTINLSTKTVAGLIGSVISIKVAAVKTE
ncbi:MAG: arsenite methyltransferase [Planctomycetota bacterium]